MDADIRSLKERIFWGTGFPVQQVLYNSGTSPHKNDSKERTATGQDVFSLEEIMETLLAAGKSDEVMVVKDVGDSPVSPEDPASFLIDDVLLHGASPKVILYQVGDRMYYLYMKKEDKPKEVTPYDIGDIKPPIKEVLNGSLYIPAGVMISRVPQHILGTGVLGRAYGSQIDILDSLVGNDYQEVLTHEVFHVIYPDKSEVNIRHMTRNYLGNAARYH